MRIVPPTKNEELFFANVVQRLLHRAHDTDAQDALLVIGRLTQLSVALLELVHTQGPSRN